MAQFTVGGVGGATQGEFDVGGKQCKDLTACAIAGK